MTRSPLLISLLAGLTLASAAAAANPELVLVASARSPLAQMTVADARKLFLGLPMAVHGLTIRPVRNLSDGVVTEMFMQKVMFMSSDDYERQIHTRVSRMGASSPASYDEFAGLMAALEQDPLTVSYMPRDRAGRALKILGEP